MSERPGACRSRCDEVPETGRHVELAPTRATRAAMARLAGLRHCRALKPRSTSRRRGRDGLRVVGPGLGDRRPDLRGDARADRERDRRSGRSGVRADAAVARPSTASEGRSDRRRRRAGTADRRRGRPRRARDRIPHSRDRSLSAQAGRGVRGPGRRRCGRQSVCGAGGAQERAGKTAATGSNCRANVGRPLRAPDTVWSQSHAPKGPHRARRHGGRPWAVGGRAGRRAVARPPSRHRIHPVRRPRA